VKRHKRTANKTQNKAAKKGEGQKFYKPQNCGGKKRISPQPKEPKKVKQFFLRGGDFGTLPVSRILVLLWLWLACLT